MDEDGVVVWCDSEIDQIEGNLMFDDEFNPNVVRFRDMEPCIDFIKSKPKAQIFLITSIADAYFLLPHMHDMRQIDSVFLLSINDVDYEDLRTHHSKIISCFNNTERLTKSLKDNFQLAQKQNMVFSFYNQHKKPTRELSRESASFLWFQLFKNALLNMPVDDEQAKQDLVKFLRQRYRNNNKQLRLIDEFERNYKPDDAIRWYTGQPFLYRHVNKTLRTEDINQLYLFRFFISDLCKSLSRECAILREFASQLTLYRGVKVAIAECEKFKENEGYLVSMNGFISTSLSKNVALVYADKSVETHQAVLFEIECDLNEVETIVLAWIARYSVIQSEEEVLIDVGAVFQITSIEYQENVMFIKMKATDDGMKIGRSYLEINQAELKERNVHINWGDLLLAMGKKDQALDYFQNIQNFDPTIEDWQLYVHIGHALAEKGLHTDALDSYLHAKEIWEKQYSTQNVSINSHLCSLFVDYGIYDQALPTLFQNLEIFNKFPEVERDKIYYHDMAILLSLIGCCYFHKGNYNQAISYFNKAYDIRENQYVTDHYESAFDCDQLGIIYRIKGDYRRALEYFEHATSIYEKVLPADHQRVIAHTVNIAVMLEEQNKQEEALKYFRQVKELLSMSPSDTLGDIAHSHDIAAHISYLEGNNEQYLENIHDALKIKRKYLPEDHHDIADRLLDMANILVELNRNDEAMNHYKEALSIYNRIAPNEHPSVAVALHGIGFIYQTEHDYKTALSHYVDAQVIYEQYFSPSSPDFARLLLCFGELYQLQGDFSSAIDAFKNCISVMGKHFESKIPLKEKTYMMLADTYIRIDNVEEALYAYEKAFSIDIDDEIQHYVYHIGYRLLMMSSGMELKGKHQKACDIRKNSAIIFEKYDYHNLFILINELFELRGDGDFNSGIDCSVYELYEKMHVHGAELIDILKTIDQSLTSSSHQQYCTRKTVEYYCSMFLYQKLLDDSKLRAATATFMGCNYEIQHRCKSARYYYEKAYDAYRVLHSETNVSSEMAEILKIINAISDRISHIESQLKPSSD